MNDLVEKSFQRFGADFQHYWPEWSGTDRYLCHSLILTMPRLAELHYAAALEWGISTNSDDAAVRGTLIEMAETDKDLPRHIVAFLQDSHKIVTGSKVYAGPKPYLCAAFFETLGALAGYARAADNDPSQNEDGGVLVPA